MLFGLSHAIWFYQHPVDFRCQIDGLVLLVADKLELDPVSGQLFIFRNRQANKLKLLWWDSNGFWLFYKRLEKGRFAFPAIMDSKLSLDKDQLSVLLAGLDFTQQSYLHKVTAKHFF